MTNSFDFRSLPVLETERLRLHPLAPADTPALLRLRSHPEVMRYMDREPLQNLSEASAWVEAALVAMQNGTGINWRMEIKNGEPFIGTVAIWRIIPEHFRGEIGYTMFAEHWGKGYMTEALSALTGYAFQTLRLHSLEANINPNNAASERLLLRLGFEKEAHFKENFFFRGEFLDSVIYSLRSAR